MAAAVIVHIMGMLSYGQLMIGDFNPLDQFPPYNVVMEALADSMDRALLPAQRDGVRTAGSANNAAGKAMSLCGQITAAARAQMERSKQAKDA